MTTAEIRRALRYMYSQELTPAEVTGHCQALFRRGLLLKTLAQKTRWFASVSGFHAVELFAEDQL